MTEIVHHLPGRLRLRVAAIRRDEDAAARLREVLSAIPGVRRVDCSTLTGSLLVDYDGARTGLATLLRRLGEAGIDEPPRRGASPVHGMAEKVVAMVVDRLVERSALALLGVLI